MTGIRSVISAMDGYVPGEQPQAGKYIKLNTNENPYPPSPQVNTAIEAAVRSGLQRYPDPVATAFRLQAEHAPGASILVTWNEQVLEATEKHLQEQLQQLSREDLTRQSLEEFAALILVRDAEEACRITNLIAPEHLHIAIDDPQPLLEQIQNAGATFLGNYAPVALGDYVAGPSHVLPTGGTARWASGLTANDFLRSGSVIDYDEAALRKAAPDVQRMADKEGLSAHRASIDIRLEADES